MKIGIVIPSFFPAFRYGGWVNSSWAICKELAKNGNECYVSTTNVNGKTPLPANNISYKTVSDKIFVKYYSRTIKERFSMPMSFLLWRDIRKSEIIYTHGIFDFCTPLALFYGSAWRKPIALSPHGCLGDWCLASGLGTIIKKAYLRLFIKPFANKITWLAASPQEEKEIHQLFKKASVQILPAGINVSELRTEQTVKDRDYYRKYLPGSAPSPGKVIVSMGRLDTKKGFDILISSFSLVARQTPDACLFIAGADFGEKKNLLTLVHTLGLDNKVFFVGHLDRQEKTKLLSNADVFALASHNENFGIVYAEALACGVPIVAATNTPWKEVEKAGVGKWVENSPASFAAAISDLLSNEDPDLSAKAQQFINAYSSEVIGHKLQALFDDLYAAGKPPVSQALPHLNAPGTSISEP